MKSNLAIIAETAIVSPKASEKPARAKATTVAQGVKIPALDRSTDPIFSRPFGTEGHTLGEAIEHQASVYKKMVKDRKSQLEKLKGIGLVLIELRSVSGASDKEYGKLIAKTDLRIMSRQDRADAMWLAENWKDVQAYMKEMDISSGSASYLRQKVRKTAKPSVEASTVEPKTDAKPSAPVQSEKTATPKSSEATEPSVEPSTVESSEATVSVDSEDDFAISMAEIAKQSGLDLNKVIQALMMLA